MGGESDGQFVSSRSPPVIGDTFRSKVWRIGNGLMAVFFMACAVVQHNDPDPELWVPVYLGASLLCISAAVSPSCQAHLGWRVLGGLEIVCCLALSSYTVLTVSEETQSVQHGHNPLFYEEGRELLGLLIIVLWIAASLVYTPERLQTPYSRKCEAAFILLTCLLSGIPLAMWAVCAMGPLGGTLAYCRHVCSGPG